MRDSINWARLLAFVTGLVNQELLLQNEYLAAENRILRAHLPSRLRLSDPERCTLAEIGKRLGRKRLKQVACTAKPDTILAWYRRLIARKFDGSRCRAYPGRPRVRHDIAPAPKRSQTTTWKDFIRRHMDVLAGTDFFTVEVLTWRGLVTYYVLFFVELESRRVWIGGITRHPDAGWMQQVARNATLEGTGYLKGCRYVLHDRDKKFCADFRDTLAAGGVSCVALPARSPNLNCYAERWVRSVKSECLSKLILFGESSLRRALTNFCQHYHSERNHQGKDNTLLFPRAGPPGSPGRGTVRCQERLGGLLKRQPVPGGNVSGARNRRHLTCLSEWKWIRQAKAVFTLAFYTRAQAWPRFSSDPWHWFGGLLPFRLRI